jgi:hypothetical protein
MQVSSTTKKGSESNPATHIHLCQVFIFIVVHDLAFVLLAPGTTLKVTLQNENGILLTIITLPALLQLLVIMLEDISQTLNFLFLSHQLCFLLELWFEKLTCNLQSSRKICFNRTK